MGKYGFLIKGKKIVSTEGQNDVVQIIFVLNKIANELAEANRLKRVELRKKVPRASSSERSREIESAAHKELEDEA